MLVGCWFQFACSFLGAPGAPFAQTALPPDRTSAGPPKNFAFFFPSPASHLCVFFFYHNDPSEAQTHNLGDPWSRPVATIPREDLQREKKCANGNGRRTNQREIFGLPPFVPPLFLGLGSQPSRPPSWPSHPPGPLLALLLLSSSSSSSKKWTKTWPEQIGQSDIALSSNWPMKQQLLA